MASSAYKIVFSSNKFTEVLVLLIVFTFVVAQGGSYKDGAPRAGWDFATGYLELVAKALGATDIQTILAEFTLAGNAPGMESLVDAKNASVASAKNAARKRAA